MAYKKLQIRRSAAASWTSDNPILADGEMGWESDAKKLKFGDGVTAWASLPYFAPGGGGGSVTSVGISVSGSGISVSGSPVTASGVIALTIGAALSALGALTPANAKLPYYTGASSAALADFTAAGISMVGAVNAAAQTALLTEFAGSAKGLVPASAGGTTNFLRADGTWSAPPGGGGSLTDGDKGDITVASSGTSWTIDAGTITLAKMANLAANSIIGNNTGVSATPIALTASQVKALLAIASSDVSGLGSLATASSVNLSSQATGTLQAAQFPALTGDVTTSAGAVATTIASGAVSLGKMANLAANSIIGNNTGVSATPIALTAAQVKTLLAVSLSTDVGGTLQAAQAPAHTGDVTSSAGSLALTIANNAVTLAKFQQIATASFIGRTTASTGNAEVLTATQATALLDTFTSSLKGLVPSSGGGTTNFLRADGTWATPAGGGGSPGGSDTQLQFNDATAFGGASGITYNKTTLLTTFSGVSLTGSQATSSIAITATWNTTGAPDLISADVTNTASGAAANLINLKTGGTSRFKVDKTGVIYSALASTATVAISGGFANYGLGFDGGGEMLAIINGNKVARVALEIRTSSNGKFAFTNANNDASGNAQIDTSLSKSAAGVLQVGSGTSSNNSGRLDLAWVKWAGMSRVSTQFDKVNTTLANVTGLSISVAAGKTYRFWAQLLVTADATGGHKVALSGTATATAINYTIKSINNGSNAFVINSKKTALDSSSGQAGATDVEVIVEGVITVNAAGTLDIQFAQNAANGTSSVLVGSSFMAHEF